MRNELTQLLSEPVVVSAIKNLMKSASISTTVDLNGTKYLKEIDRFNLSTVNHDLHTMSGMFEFELVNLKHGTGMQMIIIDKKRQKQMEQFSTQKTYRDLAQTIHERSGLHVHFSNPDQPLSEAEFKKILSKTL